MKRVKVTCPNCKKDCWLVDEKNFIIKYGKCNTCILSDALGRPYVKPPIVLTFCSHCGLETRTVHGCCNKCKCLKNT